MAPCALVLLPTGFLIPRAVAGQGASTACAAQLQPSWTPDTPVPGTLFTIRVSGVEPGATPQGRIGSEPLHFSSDSSGLWSTLAPVPIAASQTLAVILTCAGAPVDSALHDIPLASATYPLERLTVAPRFSGKPDSALAARQRREAQRAAAVSARAHETPRLWTTPFNAPRTSRITSAFGSGRQFNGTVTSRHMGTDYAGAVGAPIRAANRGVVRLVDRFFLGGNVVYLDHGEGLVTAYLHLSKHRVAEGDTVQRGQVVGEVGATGRVTGPHLHWIARYGAVTIDPQSLLRATAAPKPPP
ncbi:MAG: M23 family metallopeptidase [Gemmatimonadaceae bacterium]|nr:M23 family metallopeptidase [Gemmatimonadaceae bacterium]